MDAPQRVIDACRRLDQLGFVPATDGNVSVRLSRDEVLVTPTMVPKRLLQPAQLLVVGMDGRVRRGPGRPSSELKLHLAVYWLRPDVGAVVHAHPPVATGFAAARQPLTDPVLPEAVVGLGPVPLAEYATPSTDEVPRSVERKIAAYDALLLANHGALTIGADVAGALDRMERLEHLARVTLLARLLGGPRRLDPGEIEALRRAYRSLQE